MIWNLHSKQLKLVITHVHSVVEEGPEEGNTSLAESLKSIRMFFTEESPTHWMLIFSRSLSINVDVEDPQKNGIVVRWESSGPTDSELAEIQQFTKLQ